MFFNNENEAILENSTKESQFTHSDLLVKARVYRSEIQLLAKFVEGLGHLGVVTTIDRMGGEVMIQTTKYCWPDLKAILLKLPIWIEFLNEN